MAVGAPPTKGVPRGASAPVSDPVSARGAEMRGQARGQIGNPTRDRSSSSTPLLLMLVAMTMNVGLVSSALFGYFAGDALFLSRAPRPPSGHGAANVDACCA